MAGKTAAWGPVLLFFATAGASPGLGCPDLTPLAEGLTCREPIRFPCKDDRGSTRLACTFEDRTSYRAAALEWRSETETARCGGHQVRLSVFRLFRRGDPAAHPLAEIRDRCGGRGSVDRVRPLRRIAFSRVGGYSLPMLSSSTPIRAGGGRGYPSQYWEAELAGPQMTAIVNGCGSSCPIAPLATEIIAPAFPAAAARRGVRRSFVVLEALIDETGHVGKTRLLERGDAGLGFERAASEALARWSYRPARVEGTPIAAYWIVRIDFGAD